MPGGPYRSTPRGARSPARASSSGFLSGRTTQRFSTAACRGQGEGREREADRRQWGLGTQKVCSECAFARDSRGTRRRGDSPGFAAARATGGGVRAPLPRSRRAGRIGAGWPLPAVTAPRLLAPPPPEHRRLTQPPERSASSVAAADLTPSQSLRLTAWSSRRECLPGRRSVCKDSHALRRSATEMQSVPQAMYS